MEKSNREYSKPRMVMEKFVPQEYCAGCMALSAMSDGTWYVDFYGIGNYGKYDGINEERIQNGWIDNTSLTKGGTYAVDVYRWCGREAKSGYNPNHTNHLWSGAPRSHSQSWGWYEEEYVDFNSGKLTTRDPNGHFVKAATNGILTLSSSGKKGYISGVFSPETGGTVTNQS